MHGDAARVAGHQLVEVEVHVAVAHAAAVARPAHLHRRTRSVGFWMCLWEGSAPSTQDDNRSSARTWQAASSTCKNMSLHEHGNTCPIPIPAHHGARPMCMGVWKCWLLVAHAEHKRVKQRALMGLNSPLTVSSQGSNGGGGGFSSFGGFTCAPDHASILLQSLHLDPPLNLVSITNL